MTTISAILTLGVAQNFHCINSKKRGLNILNISMKTTDKSIFLYLTVYIIVKCCKNLKQVHQDVLLQPNTYSIG